MKINPTRLWQHINELGEIGKHKDGSITRLPFTTDDLKAQNRIASWMEDAGLSTHVDEAGNLIGKWIPANAKEGIILCGSHYDSVKHGGMFDGCLGVIGAIEAVQTLKENGFTPTHPIYVVAFKDEEGNRFGFGMVGSKAITNTLTKEGLSSLDEEGISLQEAMKEYGLHPEKLSTCVLSPIKMMLELHIEQARQLESHKKDIGIVEGIAGLKRYSITISGVSAHSGATPMSERSDPVIAMCEWITHMQTLVTQKPNCVGTVGKIETYPGACNVICDHVTFSLDIRSLSESDMDDIMAQLSLFEKQLHQKHGVHIQRQFEQSLPVAMCDDNLKKDIQIICEAQHVSYMHLMSGAGHDSMNFHKTCPIAMLFVPSKNGYSHRKEEFTSCEDCAKGTQVLMELLKKQAQ